MKKIVTYLSTIGLTGFSLFSFITTTRAAVNPINPIVIDPTAVTSIDPIDLVATIGGWMLGLAGALVVVYLIYGGILYITGGPKAEENAKKVIMNALIGLIVITLAYAIANFAVKLVQSV